MKTYLWQITAKTNLHVGNENSTSYGIIDKAVQRDVLTGLPCINSSSLKGAINEYCCSIQNNQEVMDEDNRLRIFGSDKNGKNKATHKGDAIFYDAHILYLPVQDGETLFKYATSNVVREQMKARLELFGIRNIDSIRFNFVNGKQSSLRNDFTSLCSDENLPIIARNVLKNGESKNLWYEQVVPAETIFYAVTQEKPADALQKPSYVLKDAINHKIIQIGANATIGYGYCKFDLIAEYDGTEGKK